MGKIKSAVLIAVFTLAVVFGSPVAGEEWFSEQSVSLDAETVFRLGVENFHSGDFTAARENFRMVVETYPDSLRYRDALYFLDRLKLYSPDSEAPLIRVLLEETDQHRQRTAGRIRVGAGDSSRELSRGAEWRASVSGNEVRFRADGLLSADKIVIESLEPERHLTFLGKQYRGKIELKAVNDKLLVINRLPLNYYLYGVIKKEIAPGWPMQTVKAQAVAARSFAIYRIRRNAEQPYDLGTTWLAQLYAGVEAETNQVIEAVEQTRGEVLLYQGRVVPGFFHANSGGYIETASDIWAGSHTGYIIPGADTWSLDVQHATWTERISLNTINSGLRENGYPQISSASSLQVARYLESGRAAQLQYRSRSGTENIRADRFRMAVGPELLRSTWLIGIDSRRREIVFEGRGWGHGIGMSQWGAWNMGENGLDYRTILSFYYRGALLAGNYGPGALVGVASD